MVYDDYEYEDEVYGNNDDGGDEGSSLIEGKVRSVIKVERNLADVRVS